MDSLGKIVQWHPKFFAKACSPNQFFLIGEQNTYLLPPSPFHWLYLKLSQPQSVTEAVLGVSDLVAQAHLLHTFNHLVQNNILVEATDTESRFYRTPQWNREPVVIPLASGNQSIHLLTQFPEPKQLTDWIHSTPMLHSVSVVLVDDYLDPRLASINQLFMEQKQSWLLCKVTGEQPLLGPLFIPSISGNPCWQCLATRLLHNQPMRHWIERKEEAGTLAIPIRYETRRIQETLLIFSEMLPHWRQDHPETTLLETQSIRHSVSYRPQCCACGDSSYLKQRNESPLLLHKTLKSHDSDGGYRPVPPEETVCRLQPQVSRLTGVMYDFQKLDAPEGAIATYRTSFFKTPHLDQVTTEDFIQISLGKGISPVQSQASALCESIERYAIQYQGDEPWVWKTSQQLGDQAVLPGQLAPFSERQYEKFLALLDSSPIANHAVKPYSLEVPLHWTPAWSLKDHQIRYLPLSYCFTATPFHEEVLYSRFNSNGCAAGNTLEDAILQGFLELIERDAAAMWWYNKTPRPSVDLQGLPLASLQRIEQTLVQNWSYWVLDLTNDFQIPVMVAIGQHRETQYYRFGFGCHLDPILACQRALTELCQLIAINQPSNELFDFESVLPEPFLTSENDLPVQKLSNYAPLSHSDIKEDVFYCVDQAQRLGMDTLVVNNTRPDVELHTVKVVVPGLCHIWPQLANSRLYETPLRLGWSSTRLTEEQLNPLPLFV